MPKAGPKQVFAILAYSREVAARLVSLLVCQNSKNLSRDRPLAFEERKELITLTIYVYQNMYMCIKMCICVPYYIVCIPSSVCVSGYIKSANGAP